MPRDADLTLPWPRDTTTLLQHFASTTFLARDSYPDSKLALLLSTQELNRVFHQSQAPIRAVAVNPGAVFSDIWRFLPYPLRRYIVQPVLRHIFLPSSPLPCICPWDLTKSGTCSRGSAT